MADDANRPAESDSEDEKIIKEAKRRFKRAQDWESLARKRWLEDVRFANGDSDNLWQWDGAVRTRREQEQEPCLTINKVRQHNLNILNDARQNRPGVKIKATGSGSSYKSAQVFEGIVRRIEYISNAASAYDTAMKFQVDGGIGYIELATDYAGDDTWDQEIFIRRIADPLTVYLDPDAKEADKSDAKFGFIFVDMDRDQFDNDFPEYKDKAGVAPLGDTEGNDWINDNKVRICKYYRCFEKKDRLVAFTDPNTGVKSVVRVSKVPKEILKLVTDDPETKTREIVDNAVECHLIIGNSLAETTEWAGKYIPIIPVIGEELVVDGQMDRWGHTRAAKDPQRIYNYWSSSAVQMVALQSKTPYVAPADAIEGYETYWETANRDNFSVLPYNQYTDEGKELTPPARQEPPVMAQAYLQGMTIASDELKAVSGQFQADMGEPSNEKSGRAILNRQRAGDLATAHYMDNLRMAIRCVGKQLIDLIPKIYDTERVLKIMAEDGTEQEIRIDPNATEAYFEQRQEDREAIKSVFNPSVGKYDVEADVGPGYATRRQEAWDAFVEIATKSPDIMQKAGDLMFRVADFPMADELAERFRKLLPPEITGEAPPPQLMAAQQQIQKLSQVVAHMTEENAKLQIKLKGREQLRDIESYRAETDRFEALGEQAIAADPDGLRQVVHQLVQEALANTLAPVLAASAPDLKLASQQPSEEEMAPPAQPQQPQPQPMAMQ